MLSKEQLEMKKALAVIAKEFEQQIGTNLLGAEIGLSIGVCLLKDSIALNILLNGKDLMLVYEDFLKAVHDIRCKYYEKEVDSIIEQSQKEDEK